MINFNIFTSIKRHFCTRFNVIICTNCFTIFFCRSNPIGIINSFCHCIYSCHFTFICICYFRRTIFISNIACIYCDITCIIFFKTCAKFYIEFYSRYFIIFCFYYSCCTFTIDKVYCVIRCYKIFCCTIIL